MFVMECRGLAAWTVLKDSETQEILDSRECLEGILC
jgi:hypothetical protein